MPSLGVSVLISNFMLYCNLCALNLQKKSEVQPIIYEYGKSVVMFNCDLELVDFFTYPLSVN